MYIEQEGVIKERFPNRWCSYGVSRIESIPFYHAYPGSRSMVIGTSSCNLSCRYCSNAYIAKEDPEKMQDRMYDLSPQELIQMAQKLGCHNIVFSINEPTVSLPTLLNVVEEAKTAGIPLGCLTNAYTTEESTELMSSVFSFFNIGLKGLSMEFNRDYIGIPSSEPILRNIRRLARTGHVEVTTPIIQSVNDGEIDEMVQFLVSVDREIPWHVFRLLPEHQMKDVQYPNIEVIQQTLKSVRKKLPYIYFHNFVGSDWVNTLCPNCGSEVIERFSLGCGGDRLNRFLCDDNLCPNCHQEIKLLGGKVAWNSNPVRNSSHCDLKPSGALTPPGMI
jgi:pyruvate-formate lyase-activating enzyme